MAPIQIHYFFEDGSHAMDAFIQNKCESEFLAILKKLSSIFGVDIIVETEPIKEGGIIRVFNIAPKKEDKYAQVKIRLITEILRSLITITAHVSENLLESILNAEDLIILDKAGKALEGERLNIEMAILKKELEGKTDEINKNNLIRKRKSNFYQILSENKKLIAVSFHAPENRSEEVTISRDQFKQFVLASDKLPPVEVEEAIIEIIAPVLKKGNYKWIGFYEGKRISFNMKSAEFNEQVHSSKVKFVNGTNIKCFLVIQKKINSEGQEKIVSYNVEKVNSYYENDKPLETKVDIPKKEPKKPKANKVVVEEKIQLQLF